MWDAVIGRPGQREAKSQAVIAIFQPGENNSNCNSGSGDAGEGYGNITDWKTSDSQDFHHQGT